MPVVSATGPNGACLLIDRPLSRHVLATAINLGKNIVSMALASDVSENSITASVAITSFSHQKTPPPMLLSFEDFIDFFSRMNEVRIESWKSRTHGRGCSPSPPTRFKVPCPNAKHGCPARFSRSSTATSHLVRCRYTSDEAAAAAAEDNAIRKASCPHKCLQCKVAFKTPSQLDGHVRYSHDHQPRTCRSCDNEKVYRNLATWEKHLKYHHLTPWESKKCPFASSCGSYYNYTTYRSFYSHLYHKHPNLSLSVRRAIMMRLTAKYRARS